MLIYIAGPYSKGDTAANVAEAMTAGDQVLAAGHVPLVPHLAHYWHGISPKPYETWIEIDLAYLERCDGLIRLPGESEGADQEVRFAKEKGIHIWHGVESFLAWAREWAELITPYAPTAKRMADTVGAAAVAGIKAGIQEFNRRTGGG